MLRLFGVPVKPDDARALVARLMADHAYETSEAVSAAARISDRLHRGATGLVPLEPGQRDAVLDALEDPELGDPPDGLVELRGALLRDREQRQRRDA